MDQVRVKTERLQGENQEKDRVIADLKRNLSSSEAERKSLLAMQKSSEEEVQRKTTEMQENSKRFVELSEKCIKLEQNNFEFSSELQTLKLENSSLKRRLSNTETENQKLMTEVAENASLNSDNVRSLHNEITRLKMSLAEKDGTLQQLNSEITLLRQKEGQSNEELLELREKISSLTVEANARLELHNREVEALQSVANLTKRSLAEKLDVIRELEHSLSSTVESKVTLQRDVEEYMRQVEADKLHISEEFKKKDEEIEELQNRVEFLKKNPPIDESLQCPGDLSLTEVYQRYVTAAQLLQKERETSNQLQMYIDQINTELNAKEPLISAQNEDYARMQKSYSSLQMRLVETSKELAKLRENEAITRGTLEIAEKKASILEQENNDIHRQLSNLLKKSATDKSLKSSSLLALPSSLVFSESTHANNSDLILFDNVDELLDVNQKLRESVRTLKDEMEKMKEGQDAYANSLISGTVRSNQSQIAELQEKYNELENEMFAKEREVMALKAALRSDLFQEETSEGRLISLTPVSQPSLTCGETCPSKIKLTELNAAHQRLLQEGSVLRAELNQTIESLRDSNSDLRLKLSRHEIDLQHAKEGLSNVQEEKKNLQSQLTIVQTSATEQSKLAIQLQDQLSRSRQELSSSMAQLQKTMSELNAVKYSLQNAEREKESVDKQVLLLSRENLSKQKILDEISSMKDYLIAEHNKDRENWFAEKKSLLSEREHLSELVENEKTLRFKAARDNAAALQQFQISKENFLSQIEEYKLNLSSKESEIRHLSSQLGELRTQLQKSQSQIDVLVHYRRVSRVEAPDLTSASFSTLSVDQQLRMELQFSRDEIERISQALISAAEEARTWKQIAKQNDDKFSTLSNTHQESLAIFEQQIEKLSKNRDLFRTRLQQAKDFSQEQEKRYLDLEVSHQKEVDELKSNLRSLQELNDQFKLRSEAFQSELTMLSSKLQKQTELTKAAQSRYERELLDHAAHIKVTSELHTEIDELQKQNLELTNKLSNLSADICNRDVASKTAENDLRSKLEEQQKILENLKNENQLLTSSLQDSIGENDSNEAMQIVLERLRNQKDIAEAQCESMTLEIQRLKDSLNMKSESLKQLQSELESEKLSKSKASTLAPNNVCI